MTLSQKHKGYAIAADSANIDLDVSKCPTLLQSGAETVLCE